MVKINSKDELSNAKQEKEIEIERNRNFKGQIVIEDYSELEKLYLRDVKKVDKITLKNLPQLQECTIWNCDTNELVIENCPQIKTLNVRQNNLTSLEFVKDLENLEELEIDGNSELTEKLRLYKNDWKNCQKDLQEIFELVKQNNFQGLEKRFWDLKKSSREELKETFSGFLPKEIQQKIKANNEIKTKELILNLEKEFEDKKELEKKVQELTNLSEQQSEKIVQVYLVNFGSKKELLGEFMTLIQTYQKFTEFKNQGIGSPDYYEKTKELKKKWEVVEEELESKLSPESKKETMNEVQRILNDCEKEIEDNKKSQELTLDDSTKKKIEDLESRNAKLLNELKSVREQLDKFKEWGAKVMEQRNKDKQINQKLQELQTKIEILKK